MGNNLTLPPLNNPVVYQVGDLIRDQSDDVYVLARINDKQDWIAIDIKTGCRWSNPQPSAKQAIKGLSVVALYRNANITITI